MKKSCRIPSKSPSLDFLKSSKVQKQSSEIILLPNIHFRIILTENTYLHPWMKIQNSLKTSIFDKELGSNILFLQYTKGTYFWRKAILVDRSDWCISKVYLRWLRSQWAWKQFLKMLQFRALGYILKKMYDSGMSWEQSQHHASQLSHTDAMM